MIHTKKLRAFAKSMRKGITATRPSTAFAVFNGKTKCCALGAVAYSELGAVRLRKLMNSGSPTDISDIPTLRNRYWDILDLRVVHPVLGVERDLEQVIVDLNDNCNWSREAIATLVELLAMAPLSKPLPKTQP